MRNQGDAMRSDPSAWALFSLPPVRDPEPHGRLGIEKRIGPRRSPNALLIHETITSKAEKKNTLSDCAGARKGRHPSPPHPLPPGTRGCPNALARLEEENVGGWGTLFIGRANRPLLPPPHRLTRRAHAPLSQSHGRAPRPLPDATRVR